MNECWDTVVIGAGPAGAVASWALASGGQNVLLVDKASFPREKVCGGCLSRHALRSLQSVGLGSVLARLPKNELSEFHFSMPGKQGTLALPGGIALSRRHLDAALVEEAERAGVSFRPETKGKLGAVQKNVREVLLTSKNTTHSVVAKTVLISDGLLSSALTEAVEKPKIAKGSRIGLNTVMAGGSDEYRRGTVYMASSPKGYVGLVRLEDGRLNIAAAIDFPEKKDPVNISAKISNILEAARFTVPRGLNESRWRGTPPLTRSLGKVAGERYFVLGDAAGYSEPFTGEGMAWAIDSAAALAHLLCSGEETDLRRQKAWEAWHARHIKRRQLVSRVVTRGLRYPSLVRPAVSILERKPALARSIIPFFCGARS